MNSKNTDFYMSTSQIVGAFTDRLPRVDGEYHYEPYRRPGHLNLHEQLKSRHSPRCHYFSNGKRISFTVTWCAQYGRLTLAGFEVDDTNAPFAP
jgi:hypothetical protein